MMGITQQLPPRFYQSAVNGCRTFRSSKNNLRQLNHENAIQPAF